jgi:hypothetical protein
MNPTLCGLRGHAASARSRVSGPITDYIAATPHGFARIASTNCRSGWSDGMVRGHPVTRTTGIRGRMVFASRATSHPESPGITMSVISRSTGFCRRRARPAKPPLAASTIWPSSWRRYGIVVRQDGSSSMTRRRRGVLAQSAMASSVAGRGVRSCWAIRSTDPPGLQGREIDSRGLTPVGRLGGRPPHRHRSLEGGRRISQQFHAGESRTPASPGKLGTGYARIENRP